MSNSNEQSLAPHESGGPDQSALLHTALVYGAAWGFVEATLGYLLHLLRRVTPLPGLTAYILFPIGFFLMMGAYRATGRSVAVLMVAAVAAVVKITSVALPSVQWLFVGNPAISILAEGLLVFAGVTLFSFDRNWTAIPKATATAIGWRALFLLAVFLLPVQKGILMKGASALITFVFVDSLINGVLIGGLIWSPITGRRLQAAARGVLGPVGATVAVAVAAGAELLFASL